MYTEFEIRELRFPLHRPMVEKFLADEGLRLEAVDYYAGLFALGGDELLAGGGLSGGVIKCIAVSEELRGEAVANRLVSHLISVLAERGYTNAKLYTKPENRSLFESLSFRVLAQAPKAILMESGTGGIADYCNYLQRLAQEAAPQSQGNGPKGVIVMNANPFTIGHRYLIQKAAEQTAHLFVIAVKEDCSQFSYQERLSMIRECCRNLSNVTICEGSDYAISAATFPTYFLKELSQASDTQMMLDLDLFRSHIAPALGATIRFVGSESNDATTRRYNELMLSILPDVRIVERLCLNGSAVSATSVRKALAEGDLYRALPLVPTEVTPYLIAHLATQALQQELEFTPKPGLVDCNDNGAHTDMDYSLMQQSIRTLHPYFVQIARLGFREKLPTLEQLRSIGLEAEKDMLKATNGVNTHKGALFALGLATAAAAYTLFNNKEQKISENDLKSNIIRMAALFPATAATHGSEVEKKYGVQGALTNAQNGYPQLFAEWLAFYNTISTDKWAPHKLLLRIISQLCDTNIYHRTDEKGAIWAREQAEKVLNSFSVEQLESLNRLFIARNISPGGAADMLALTLFIRSIT